MKSSYRKEERRRSLIKQIGRIPFVIGVFSILCFLYEIGFEHESDFSELFKVVYLSALFAGLLAIIFRYFFKENRSRYKIIPFDLLLFSFLLLVISQNILPSFIFEFSIIKHVFWLHMAVFLVFIREFSVLQLEFKKAMLNPAQLFVMSFLAIIILGSFLLLLPKATVTNISLIDAIFTSTSAVCVTGLIVVDTGSAFTDFGQFIIALLIQIGGLGIMTFASYFGYFFKGSSSYESQLKLRDMTNTEKISEVYAVLKKIILITFLIEGVGSILIFKSIDATLFPRFSDRLFFSVFHSISGFCNAGFSTLPNNFYETAFQFNYPLHLTVSFLIILGGLGFPIVLNLLTYLKSKFVSSVMYFFHKKKHVSPWLININTRIVLISSFILTVLGTIAFFVLEYDNTLSGHSFAGKVITAFFGSVTARTAGFNTVDTAALSIPTLLIVMFLMWVGASPASTGGGIKTSTLAVATLNILSIVKGSSRLEVYNREIPGISVNRAFAIIVLSIVVISISTLCILFFEPDKGLLNICFESISAYGTVGLSRGITAGLDSASKIVLILTMFLGRISTLTLLIAVFKKVSNNSYRYPTDNILIN